MLDFLKPLGLAGIGAFFGGKRGGNNKRWQAEARENLKQIKENLKANGESARKIAELEKVIKQNLNADLAPLLEQAAENEALGLRDLRMQLEPMIEDSRMQVADPKAFVRKLMQEYEGSPDYFDTQKAVAGEQNRRNISGVVNGSKPAPHTLDRVGDAMHKESLRNFGRGRQEMQDKGLERLMGSYKAAVAEKNAPLQQKIEAMIRESYPELEYQQQLKGLLGAEKPDLYNLAGLSRGISDQGYANELGNTNMNQSMAQNVLSEGYNGLQAPERRENDQMLRDALTAQMRKFNIEMPSSLEDLRPKKRPNFFQKMMMGNNYE